PTSIAHTAQSGCCVTSSTTVRLPLRSHSSAGAHAPAFAAASTSASYAAVFIATPEPWRAPRASPQRCRPATSARRRSRPPDRCVVFAFFFVVFVIIATSVDFSTRSIRYARFARASTTFFRRHRQPPTLRQFAALRRVAAIQANLGVGARCLLIDLGCGDRVAAPPAHADLPQPVHELHVALGLGIRRRGRHSFCPVNCMSVSLSIIVARLAL